MLIQHSSTSLPPEHQDVPVLWGDLGQRRPVHSVLGVMPVALSGASSWGCVHKASGISAEQCPTQFKVTPIGVGLGLSTVQTSIVQRSVHMIGSIVWACQLICLACLGSWHVHKHSITRLKCIGPCMLIMLPFVIPELWQNDLWMTARPRSSLSTICNLYSIRANGSWSNTQ